MTDSSSFPPEKSRRFQRKKRPFGRFFCAEIFDKSFTQPFHRRKVERVEKRLPIVKSKVDMMFSTISTEFSTKKLVKSWGRTVKNCGG